MYVCMYMFVCIYMCICVGVCRLHSQSRFYSFALISLIGIAICCSRLLDTRVQTYIHTYVYVHSFIHMYYKYSFMDVTRLSRVLTNLITCHMCWWWDTPIYFITCINNN